MNPSEHRTPSDPAARAEEIAEEESAAWPEGLMEPSPVLPTDPAVADPDDLDDPRLDEAKLEVERLEGRQEAGRE